tara:strand:+ start:4308 stop:4814 length:507 start_codon:yes stop_codon:yes gene_type:complete
MATYKDYKISVYDDFFTQEETFKQLSKYIPKDKKVYMPFYSPYSNCNELLGKYIDNEIIYEDKDFFDYKITDGIVCDNPPFSSKQKILKKLYEDDVAFMLILPISTLAYRYFRIFNKEQIQICLFNGRQNFNKCDDKGVINKTKNHSAFDTCVICYKMNLPSDIIFLD